MNSRILIIAACALLLLVSRTESIGQTAAPPSSSTPSPKPSPSPGPPIDVMYTGKLFGYFRVPSLQKLEKYRGCPKSSDVNSPAAKEFLAKRQVNKAILVGTGDNFSPQLEARMFSDPESDPAKASQRYFVGNKELYVGNGDDWIFYKDVGSSLANQIAQGFGTIPTDNVGCFLRKAGFAAIVPGKHDFYFGAERVRQLARFLASTSAENNSEPVQMLGANLVLKTVHIEGPDPEKPSDIEGWPKEFPVLNLKEGKSVYPWFTHIKIKLNAKNDLKGRKISLCDFPRGLHKNPEHCQPFVDPKPVQQPDDKTFIVTLKLEHLGDPHSTNAKGKHFSTLVPGTSYGLCIDPPKGTNQKPGCLRFSSHIPFFYFPHAVPKASTDNYTDPDPFVVKDDRIAIFGVVDPALGEQVGVLNFGFTNIESELTTRLSVEDPREALEQQLDYFNDMYPDFHGLKILLAQMNPQRARALATKIPQFQIVVSAADNEQGTSEEEMSNVWDPDRQKRRAFLAIPNPYFDSREKKGYVHFGTVKASEDNSGKWTLATLNPKVPEFIDRKEIVETEDPNDKLWETIRQLPGCLPKNAPGAPLEKQESLKLLVLCAMRDYTSADVALIQHQDLYEKIPQPDPLLLKRATNNPLNDVQQMLDRLIWKGDLVMLLYVPGGDLKKALEQSDTFRNEESSPLTVSVDRGRHLETLGIVKPDGEYLINGLRIEDDKIYAVATTDYLGAGDTGYPDLVKAALNPRTHPGAFPSKLVPISSLVCRKLLKEPDASNYCLQPIISSKYLDVSAAKEIPTYKRPGVFQRTWDSLEFDWPAAGSKIDNRVDALEQRVQRREIWRFSLQNFSLGFKTLNNNFTDDEVDDKFEGVPLQGVTAHESRTFNFGLNSRLTRSSHKRELFFALGADYERQSVGDDPSEFDVSLADNRLFGEAGFVFWRRPGRAYPNIGLNVSMYTETHLRRPFSVFTLANDDHIRIIRDRSLLVLPRVGVRWENKANSFEIGAQGGYEINALSGYVFNTQGAVAECFVSSGVSFKKCIATKSDPKEGGTITKDSDVKTLFDNRPRAGVYWKTQFSVSLPFTSKVKYEVEQTADFFFVNFGHDTSVDTRFRDISKHRLSFIIWPSVSIGPALDLLLYQNKINRDFLFQRQFGIETKVSFDIFNRREKGVQFKHKP